MSEHAKRCATCGGKPPLYETEEGQLDCVVCYDRWADVLDDDCPLWWRIWSLDRRCCAFGNRLVTLRSHISNMLAMGLRFELTWHTSKHDANPANKEGETHG